ncbi:MAG: undecaprenyl/decaprenyl-phosphate alpha-N-acetylglucosaminyl 1-phosphate transferase, partial [Paludibacteraceae bacterium]|nr:undecaprenyl/decaprenyl-phosphate alpha-N-acetylglucosaminyl 1-phosphate transferase [Paludibacteraceae bacterium]
ALYFQHIGEIHLATLGYCLIGSLAVFFIYNVFGRTRHKIFMGDSGSLLLGYMITLFVFRFCELNTTLTGVSHVSSAPAFMIGLLAIPLFDTVRVMVTRIKQKKSPFSADKNHMHHLLLKMGLSHVQVTLVLLIVSLGSLALSLLLRHLANGYLIMVIFLYCCTFTFIVWRILDWKNRKKNSSEV